jgi:hypothetical protein
MRRSGLPPRRRHSADARDGKKAEPGHSPDAKTSYSGMILASPVLILEVI